MKPDFYATDQVPLAEWREGNELNFDTLQKRIYRLARIYIATEAIDDQNVSVKFTFDGSVLNGKSDAEITELIAAKVLDAIREARECYVSWKSKKRKCGCCGKRATECLASEILACCTYCSTHCRAPGAVDKNWYHGTISTE